ncbi:Nicotinate-nucleotide pyrophosphorylase [Ceratobasidium theobromae]|uniref:Nicotinate-nucleotide pyrophosphorylase [carboxylating] n=1 Tax=Ceratobasidium theobromae TaxID=1582974 RepID=A0A5N5QIG1_9AGAM|nr:Nicotinate-nucleotide pyrophosphorylase [Ceratobasidium theobromae]
MQAKYPEFAHLLPPSWKSVIQTWLVEDTPSFDWGGYVVGEVEREAFLLGKGKELAVLAGVPFVDEVFSALGCSVHWHLREGDVFEPVAHVATVRGPARHLLLGERVALNVLARCSGIATKSRRFRDTARAAGFKGTLAGTRKTTPGFRLVEKYGMLVGGIDPHRFDLSSMVMLKDNHVWSTGSIAAAIATARRVAGFSLMIDVEVRNEREADEAIEAGADVIMLDNIEGDALVVVARRLRERWRGRRAFKLETSGGIEDGNLVERAINDIDILSTSAVHQGVPHVDFSLKLQVPGMSAASSYSSHLDVPMASLIRSKGNSRATSVSAESIDLAAEAAADLEAELA